MPDQQQQTDPATEPAVGTMTAISRSLGSALEAGREILARRRHAQSAPPNSTAALVGLCKELLDHRGEASGLALASEITASYRQLPSAARLEFFSSLASDFDVDPQEILSAADSFATRVAAR